MNKMSQNFEANIFIVVCLGSCCFFKSVKSCLEVKTSRNQSKFSFIVFFLQFNFLLSSSSSYSRLKWRCKKIWSDDCLKSKLAFTSVSSSFLNVSLSLSLSLVLLLLLCALERIECHGLIALYEFVFRSESLRVTTILHNNDDFVLCCLKSGLNPMKQIQSQKTIIVKIFQYLN